MKNSSEQSANTKEKWSGRLANTRLGFDLIRQVLIVLVVVLFLRWPTVLKSSFAALGIESANIAGWQFNFARKSSENTGDAIQRLGEASKTLASAQEQAESLAKRADMPLGIKDALKKLTKTLEQSSDTTKNAEQNLNASLSVQTSIIQNVPPQEVAESGPWGIVISADKSDPDAKDEVAKARRNGFEKVRIYDRQDWLRTVVEFSNFTEAQAALPQLKSIPNHGSAYLVNMAKWCATSKDRGDGVLQCTSS